MISFIESEFQTILEEVEHNSHIYRNDIATVVADELQEYNSRKLNEINECRESIHHKMELLGDTHDKEVREVQSSINFLHGLELAESLINIAGDKHSNKDNRSDYNLEYMKCNNRLQNSNLKFDIEFKKYESELRKLEEEYHSIEHVIHEYDQWEKCGFDINYVFKDSSKKFTLLHCAANFGDTNVTKLLLEEGASVDIRDENKNTPLHLAASSGHTDIVKLLMKKGSDFSAVNKKGNTSLHLAAFNGHIDTVKFLLEEGSDLSAINKDGDTPLNTAFYNNRTEVVKYLMEKEPRMKEMVEHLVKCVVESKTHNLLTPLHLAAVYDCTEVVESLLEEGENPLSKDINGRTPRELATDENLVQIFKAAEIKQQEYDAIERGITIGKFAAGVGTGISAVLFATGFTIGFLPIVGAVAVVTTSALAIGGATYMALKPHTEKRVDTLLPSGQLTKV